MMQNPIYFKIMYFEYILQYIQYIEVIGPKKVKDKILEILETSYQRNK